MSVRLVAVILLATLVAGCEMAEKAPPSGPRMTEPARKPGAPARSRSATLPEAPPRPTTPLDPDRLVGLDQEQTVEILGPPTVTGSEDPATVWTYTAGNCSLDLMFYLDLKSQRFHALAYRVNTEKASEEARRECLAKVGSRYLGRQG